MGKILTKSYITSDRRFFHAPKSYKDHYFSSSESGDYDDQLQKFEHAKVDPVMLIFRGAIVLGMQDCMLNYDIFRPRY